MRSKHLLLMLLLALMAPWVANAQTFTVYEEDGTEYNEYVPFQGYNADSQQHNQMIYPATALSNNMVGKVITQMVFYIQNWGTSGSTQGNWTVSLGETTATTLSGLDNTTTLTQVYSGQMVYNSDHTTMTITFDDGYTYNGGNLLVDFNHAAAGWRRIYFYGKTVTGASYCYGSQRNFLDKVTFTYQNPPACPKPTNLACTATTGTPATATFTWTNGGTETDWVLQYGTASDLTGATSVEISASDLVNGAYTLTGLTAETKYYARIKADCGSGEESDWSNTIDFKPTNVQTVPVGSGEETNSYLPAYTTNNNTLSEQIYTETEIGMTGTISSLAFYNDGTTKSPNLKIYLVHTEKAAFTSATDWLTVTADDLVFEGDVTLTAGQWTTIEFDDEFEYEGGNLGLIVDENMQWSGGLSCRVFDGTENCSMYVTSDGTNYNAVGATYSGTRLSVKNQLQLGILPCATPKPRNLTVSNITPNGATLSWEAPASITPTGYEYQYKLATTTDWPANWTSNGTYLNVALNLNTFTNYDFRVRATYAEGNSDPVEISFKTLPSCATPTNFVVTTIPGQGTKATFTWVKGYDEEAWVLEYSTDENFHTGVQEVTEGFIVEGNNVTYNLTGLTPETHYYAHLRSDCGGGVYSGFGEAVDFTPTNYVDYTFGDPHYSTCSSVPFYGYYVSYNTLSQFIIPAESLVDVAGGTIKRMTFHSSTASASFGTATFNVYVKEVEATSFSAASADALEDWASMTIVYSGALSISGNQMVIDFTEPFSYGNGNLMIGFNETAQGTGTSVSWYYVQGPTNSALYGYKTSAAGNMNYYREKYLPKITFNYQPTPYKKPVIDEENCTFGTTSAHIAWTVTDATPTSYKYQYKLASAAEWPTTWTTVTTAYANLNSLIAGTAYDFRVMALYEGNHESAVVDYSFFTACGVVATFPWKEDFEAYSIGEFNHPCWVNERIVDGTGTSGSLSVFQIYSYSSTGNNTQMLRLPDMKLGTITKLVLPQMTLPNTNYQFVLDIYRNTDSKPTEGIRVFVSTNGELEGATELCFISRDYTVASAPYIPAEEASGWYTYELPLGIQGTCYVILQGESQYGSSTYMDNFTVEAIPTCARPSDLAKSNVTNHSATISWVRGDEAQTLWQIAYSKTAFDPNVANFNVNSVSTVSCTVDNDTCSYRLDKVLDAASTYYVYVRANCGTATEPEYGPWSRKDVSFTTLAATPAPSNFVASNPASEKVDLVWTAGGGDFESWELYYVASETAPEAPTAATAATVTNITTLPTAEVPYVLEGLDPVTKYYAWLRAKHVWNNQTSYTDWVALTGDFFETLDACPTPYDLTANNITSVSANLSWVGSDDVTEGYTVEYGLEGTYSINSTQDFSDQTPVGYSSSGGQLPTGWFSYNTSTSGYAPRVSNNSNYSYISSLTGNYLLMTTNATTQYAYAIMPQYSNLGSVSFDYQYENTNYGTLTVGYVTNNEGYSTYQVLETPNKNSGKQTWTITSEHLATINNANGYVAFRYESGNGTYYSVGIDNVTVKGGTYTPGATQTVQSEETSITISDLTPNKSYIAKVKSNCTNGEYCEPISFTTLTAGQKVFATEGNWSTANNWVPSGAPSITDTVILRANATIESGCVAEAKKINGTATYTLTIANGGQLMIDTQVNGIKVKKNIGAYPTGSKAGYYLIANPTTSAVTPTIANGLLSGNYDLYQWNTSATENYDEWRNYRVTTFTLAANGTKGYLYANAEDAELTFTGNVKANNTDVTSSTLNFTTGTENLPEFNGWNLLANPFVCNAYLTLNAGSGNPAMAYYKMNAAGSGFEASTAAIAPMEGIFVKATAAGQTVKFSRTAPVTSPGQLNINLAQNTNTRDAIAETDNAIVRFDGGMGLEKFSFREGSSKVFIPQEGKDYAVVSAEAQGELPVSFKAENNGSYTLSFSNENVEFGYLHLIDNMTGEDVNLLETPSYSFEAKTTDYASRFKLVFSTGNGVNDESFAFISDGNIILNGEGMLQVVDVMGRIMMQEENATSVSTSGMTPGVYVLRLINGDSVKTQKIVIK